MKVMRLWQAAVFVKAGSYVIRPKSSSPVLIWRRSMARMVPCLTGISYVLPVRLSVMVRESLVMQPPPGSDQAGEAKLTPGAGRGQTSGRGQELVDGVASEARDLPQRGTVPDQVPLDARPLVRTEPATVEDHVLDSTLPEGGHGIGRGKTPRADAQVHVRRRFDAGVPVGQRLPVARLVDEVDALVVGGPP